jgi:hypothetical protein
MVMAAPCLHSLFYRMGCWRLLVTMRMWQYGETAMHHLPPSSAIVRQPVAHCSHVAAHQHIAFAHQSQSNVECNGVSIVDRNMATSWDLSLRLTLPYSQSQRARFVSHHQLDVAPAVRSSTHVIVQFLIVHYVPSNSHQ